MVMNVVLWYHVEENIAITVQKLYMHTAKSQTISDTADRIL